jgi:glycosyltransferase involved in cell wall biosynthesis
MKIVFVLPSLEHSGGVKVVSIYSRMLRRRGHSVLVASPRFPHRSGTSRLSRILNILRNPVKENNDPGPDAFNLSKESHIFLSHLPILEDDLPDADIIVATWWETAEWIKPLSSKKGRKVYFIQHHEVFDYLPQKRCRDTYRFPYHKIVIARWLKNLMQEEYGDSEVSLVSNAVDHEQFFATPRGRQSRPTIGFLNHEVSFKGVDLTLEAIEILRLRIENLRVLSFGAVPNKGKSSVPNYVEYFQQPSQEKIRDLYSQCDAWMTASRSEGFNLPAMEAMACRTPVISSMTGWPMEAIVHQINGALVNIGDVAALASAAEWILRLSDEAWRSLSEKAYLTVKDLNWESSTDRLEDVLEKLLLQK